MKKESAPLQAFVLSPSQFDEELAGLMQQPRYDRHAVTTRVPDAVARLFESSLMQQHAGMSLHQTWAGRSCALLSLQAGPALLRIFVALGTTIACDWLIEGLQRGAFIVALDVKERHQLAVVQVAASSSASALEFARNARSHAPWNTNTPDEFAQFLTDVGRPVQALLRGRPESMLPGFKVESSYFALAFERPRPSSTVPTIGTRH